MIVYDIMLISKRGKQVEVNLKVRDTVECLRTEMKVKCGQRLGSCTKLGKMFK